MHFSKMANQNIKQDTASAQSNSYKYGKMANQLRYFISYGKVWSLRESGAHPTIAPCGYS